MVKQLNIWQQCLPAFKNKKMLKAFSFQKKM
jgi:hypothetical protein